MGCRRSRMLALSMNSLLEVECHRCDYFPDINSRAVTVSFLFGGRKRIGGRVSEVRLAACYSRSALISQLLTWHIWSTVSIP